MEIKELLPIFNKQKRIFFGTIIVFLALASLYVLLTPQSYKASLALNITRIGTQETDNYRFDGFYRLQADEKFADTIVRWLGGERFATDILNDSKITTSGMSARSLAKFFHAQRLSAQYVRVTYVAGDVATAQSLSRSVVKILNSETEKLNRDQKENNWFQVLGSDPVIKENKLSWPNALAIALILGAFFGFWAVMVRNYLEN